MSVVEYRRQLHRIPELDNQLPETTAYVRSVLEPLGCKVFTPITGSVCAWFDAGRHESVAFRADLAALRLGPSRRHARLRPRRPHRHGAGPGGICGRPPL